MALLAEKPAFMEGDSGSLVMRGKVVYGRPGPGIFDDVVSGAAAWTEPLTRRQQIQGDEIVVPEGLDTLNRYFLRGSFVKRRTLEKAAEHRKNEESYFCKYLAIRVERWAVDLYNNDIKTDKEERDNDTI